VPTYFDGKQLYAVLNRPTRAQLTGKPVSCHLYPIRVKDFTEFAAVNYDKWDICDPACSLGQELKFRIQIC
jgi:hypothetical protein